MNCIPCRVTFEGKRYEIAKDGTVRPVRPVDVAYAEPAEPVSPEFAKDVRREAGRQRSNRNRRERDAAMRDLGLTKTPYGW